MWNYGSIPECCVGDDHVVNPFAENNNRGWIEDFLMAIKAVRSGKGTDATVNPVTTMVTAESGAGMSGAGMLDDVAASTLECI